MSDIIDGHNSPVPQVADLLITGGYILTLDDDFCSYYPGSIVVINGRIVAVGLSETIDPRFDAAERLDATDSVIMPGLVNIHGHASNSLIRGIGVDLPLYEWLQRVCWPCMGNANEEDLYTGVLLSCLEMLRNGVTTFADMWIGVPQAARAVEQSGLRAMLAHNIKDFNDPRRGEQEMVTAIEVQRQWHGYAHGRVNVGLGPHSVYTCRPELLAEVAQLARDNDVHVQIHGSETKQEVQESRARFGRSPIELMDSLGLLRRGTVVAHAVHLTDYEVQQIQSTGTAIAHNIASNLKLASGIAPVHRYRTAGICVGLGTDGPGSNDGLDLLRDLKTAVLLQRAIAEDATCLPTDAALAMATRDGARALGLETSIGILQVGYRADIILVDLDRPHFTPHHLNYPSNVPSLLVYCASGADVTTVIVDGRILMRHGKALSLDTEALMNAAQTSSERILRRSGLL